VVVDGLDGFESLDHLANVAELHPEPVRAGYLGLSAGPGWSVELCAVPAARLSMPHRQAVIAEIWSSVPTHMPSEMRSGLTVVIQQGCLTQMLQLALHRCPNPGRSVVQLWV
jgi:hypothetical protein